jgi:hypothetical protein
MAEFINHRAMIARAANPTIGCNTCKNNDTMTGCRLQEASICVYMGFSHYEKGDWKLIHCERCGKNLVRERIGGLSIVPPDPCISFWCLNCDDYPIVDGKKLSRKELSSEDRKYWLDKANEEQAKFMI